MVKTTGYKACDFLDHLDTKKRLHETVVDKDRKKKLPILNKVNRNSFKTHIRTTKIKKTNTVSSDTNCRTESIEDLCGLRGRG